MIRICTLVLAAIACGCNAPTASAAEDDVQKEARTLLIGRITQQIDDTCGLLPAEDRKIYDHFIDRLIKESSLPAEVKKQINERDKTFKPNCDAEDSRAFIAAARNLVASAKHEKPEAELSENRDEQSCLAELRDARNALDPILSSKQAAVPERFIGCWKGPIVTGWSAEFCTQQNGDSVNLTLRKDGTNHFCELSGRARSREGGIYFGVFTDSFKCSDGGRIEHAEGFCTLRDQEETQECLISVFSCGNFFYSDPADREKALNGTFALKRRQ